MIDRMIKAGVGASLLLAMVACSGEQSPGAAGQAVAAETATTPADQSGMSQLAGDAATTDESFVVASADGHGMHDYAPPALDTLGGKFELTEATTGKTFTDSDLLGSWSLVYLGYMECLVACPIALKSMPVAVKDLQAAGIPAKAVFIDINAPRLDDMSGAMGHGEGAEHAAAKQAAASPAAGGHGSSSHGLLTGPEVRRQAIAVWGKQYDPNIVMLSGTRKQVILAKNLFKTRVEQSMLPTEESIHHLNHTTYVYVVNPKGDVAGMLYHSDSTKKMADTVKELARPGSTPT